MHIHAHTWNMPHVLCADKLSLGYGQVATGNRSIFTND